MWQLKKRELELTQVKAAAALGITQASFSQYLNCVIALNTDMVVKLSSLLRVQPRDISPHIDARLQLATETPITAEIPVLASIGGRLGGSELIEVAVLGRKDARGLYAVLLAAAADSSGIPEGSYLILDPFRAVSDGDRALITTHDQERLLVEVRKRTTKSISVINLIENRKFMRLPVDTIFSIHGIHSVQFAGG